nr:AsmA family protein [Caulobacteraceae bacterium]
MKPLPVAGGGLLLALIFLIVLFQWNWLRGPLAGYLGGQLHRPVAIKGDLKVHPWSWSPWATLDDVTVGNPAWAGGGTMARLPRLKVQIRLPALLGGDLVMPLVAADRPDVRLFTDAAGRANWSGAKTASPPRLPAIGRLVISGGTVRYTDAKRRLAFTGALSSDERADGGPRGISTVQGRLTVDNPAWAGPGPMASVPRLTAKVGLLPLMRGRLVIPLVEADRPDVRLVRDAAGRNNWTFDTAKPKPLKAPPIGRVVIRDGALRYDDAGKGLSFAGTASSSETLTGASRGVFLLQGQGLLKKARFVARLSGGPLIHVDPRRPYPFEAKIETGSTRVAVTGRLARPFEFSALSGSVHVSGLDFADLYHLTDVALPSTPPYDLTAGFARSGALYAFSGIHGRVGDSDLGGALSVDGRTGRPFVKADLSSRRLKLADLTAVVGGAPKTLAGHTVSPAQRVMAVKLRAEHRLFPDARLEVSRVRTTDARLTYAAQSVDAGRLPIRNLSLRLALDHGLLTIDPLSMGLPQGQLAGNIRLDARGAVPAEAIDMRLTNARVENLIG